MKSAVSFFTLPLASCFVAIEPALFIAVFAAIEPNPPLPTVKAKSAGMKKLTKPAPISPKTPSSNFSISKGFLPIASSLERPVIDSLYPSLIMSGSHPNILSSVVLLSTTGVS